MTYYEILGIDNAATTQAVDAAYKRLSAQLHPDKKIPEGYFRELQTARETLMDPQRRAAYDQALLRGAAGGAPPPGPPAFMPTPEQLGQVVKVAGRAVADELVDRVFGGLFGKPR